MNGTPQPKSEMTASAGIEPRSLDYESQPLTIGPFLTGWAGMVLSTIIVEIRKRDIFCHKIPYFCQNCVLKESHECV